MIAGIKVNGKIQKITYKIKRCICAPHRLLTKFNPIGLLAPSNMKGKNKFQTLVELLPDEHKAKWFAGAALNTSEQSMSSVISTALSRLNSFLDSELEQILCFDTEIDAEEFCNQKSAIFLIMPEEDPNKFFMISLIIQQLYREILSVADELKSMPKGQFIVTKTGVYPMKVKLQLFFKWGIRFEEAYSIKERGNRTVKYASSKRLVGKILEKYPHNSNKENRPYAPPGEYKESSTPPVSVAILNAVKQELDKHETELKTQSTFAHLRDAIVSENIDTT